jgi:hypothetical protein
MCINTTIQRFTTAKSSKDIPEQIEQIWLFKPEHFLKGLVVTVNIQLMILY